MSAGLAFIPTLARTFTAAWHKFWEEKDYDAAEELYIHSIDNFDNFIISSAFIELSEIYKKRNDRARAEDTLRLGIKMSNEYNEKEANRLTKKFPQYKDDFEECLETCEPFPKDWLEKNSNPLFRPDNTLFLIDLLDDLEEKDKKQEQLD